MSMSVKLPGGIVPESNLSGGREIREHASTIGAILVDLGRLSPGEVAEIQRFANAHGLMFADAAVQLNILRPDDVESALARQYDYPILARGGRHGVADEVIAAYSPQDAGIDPLRAIRSQLTFRWLRTANRAVLTIVSPDRGEGRSWFAANLATMFAQAGHRTLLIDANLRRPRQHELFNLDNSMGLAALLSGRAGRDVAHRIHEQMRLFVMPAGGVPPNPQELLERPVLDIVLDQCAAQFDLVLIDTPSITEASDAQILSSHAGSALMLAHRHHTRHARLTAAMESIKQSGGQVIGSVISEH
jgi:chain length determinant protein tyrosine kinase EpsG